MEDAVAAGAPAFLIRAARVGAEQHAAGLQRRVQLLQHAWQRLTRDMEQRGVGENAVKVRGRQIEMQEILLPDVAASRVTRHCDEALGAIEADRAMAKCGEGLEIAP